MNITAKSRYALKIMMDLAVNEEHGHQQRQSIALRQSVPLDFMDQITSRLRAAGLVESIRGRSGGFQLAKSPADISMWAIFEAVEDSLYPVKCLDHEKCELEASCISSSAWNDILSVLKTELMKKSLFDVVAKWKLKKKPLKEQTSAHPSVVSCSRPHLER